MGILYILLTTGPTFVAVNGILPNIAVNTYYALNLFYFDDLPVYVSLYSSGCLTPLIIVVFVPLYLFLLRAFIHDYIPGMLKRMGLGMILLFISGLCTLAMTSTGHDCRTYDSDYISDDLIYSSSLNSCFKVSLHYLILQNSLNAVGYTLLYIASYKFICAQSPHAMKGLLIGTYFAIRGIFQLLGVLAIYTPIGVLCKLQGKFQVCGFIYYLINIVIGLSGILAFIFVAKKYQYRQRDEPDNIYRYVEEYYAKAQNEPNYDSDNYDNLNVETNMD